MGDFGGKRKAVEILSHRERKCSFKSPKKRNQDVQGKRKWRLLGNLSVCKESFGALCENRLLNYAFGVRH